MYICKITNIECSECQPVCGSRKEITKEEYDKSKLNELRECGKRISKTLNITQEYIDRVCKEARRICK